MTRRPSTLDQFLGIGGSDVQNDNMDQALEPLELGQAISGQTGSVANITALIGTTVTMTGLTGITSDSVGRFITITGAATPGNNGTFRIIATFGSTTINYENSSAAAPDSNNGSIFWIEREPYTLEHDLNHSRTDRRLIKGTTNWYDSLPIYNRPTDPATDVSTNLTTIAGNTLDAHAWIEPRFHEAVNVSVSDSFITITNTDNLQHASASDITGVPVSDGYDVGNDEALFVAIVDADIDGYGDGSELRVLTGIHQGERIFGQTRAGSSTSPDSVEIVFFSTPVDDWDLASASSYTWEAGQPSIINVSYGYRQRLDLFNETALRSIFIKGALSNTGSSGGGSGTGITENQHKALRHLIHFIDSGPADGFASGSFHEILPSGNPFPTSYTWWESSAKTEKIVELLITRGDGQKPITEIWNMYDADGSTIVATVTDTITYSGPFEVSRMRATT